MIQPLTKRKMENGQLYTRPAPIQHCLEVLNVVPKPARTEQLEMGVTDFGEEIPPEALVHFARAAWRENDQVTFKRLFLALCAQVEQLTLRAIPDSRLHNAADARESAMAKFVDLVSEDCKGLHDRLDYFEMYFNSGLARMRISVVRKHQAANKKRIETRPLFQKNSETGEEEIPPKLEEEAARLSAKEFSRLDDLAFRSTFFAAIDKLPPELREALLLHLKRMPIEVEDPNTMTIVRTLKCTRRTVQNRITRGILALQALLQEETCE